MSKNRLDFTANLGRHNHDVTAGYTASLAPGMIVPQYFDILQPGEKIFYRTHMFARFQNIVNPFLGEVDLHIKYFFVPLQMLYTPFGQIFAQTNDVLSSQLVNPAGQPDNFPVGDLNHFFNTVYDSWQSATIADGTTSKLCASLRLLDSLNFNALVYRYAVDQTDSRYQIPNGTFFSLLAYQAIYQKAFRNEEIERFDIESFNVDYFYNNNAGRYTDAQLTKMLTLRFCGRPNDYFTSVRTSPIATSVNALSATPTNSGVFGDGGSPSYLETLFSKVSDFLDVSDGGYGSLAIDKPVVQYDPDSMNRFGGSYGYRLNTDDNISLYSPLTAQNIRALFALDKYMRVYGRAGKTYDDQILAHFGVKIPHDVKHDLTELKHYRVVLQADPIYSTADTSEGSVGSVGGQCSGEINTDEASFTAPVHGVFMAVAFVQTHPRYFCTNDKLNAISNRLNFPIPEFDKLGAQPVHGYEYGRRIAVDESSTPIPDPWIWQNRYQEFKQKYNRCSLAFAHDLMYLSQGTNFFSTWVISRRPYAGNSVDEAFTASQLFERPWALDNVMKSHYDGRWSDEYVRNPHLMFETDPIMTEFCCFAKKVSWMSPTGEPDL